MCDGILQPIIKTWSAERLSFLSDLKNGMKNGGIAFFSRPVVTVAGDLLKL